MVRKYTRTSNRNQWSEADLEKALDELKNENHPRPSLRSISKKYNVSVRTLKRRQENYVELNRLGPDCALGTEAESKLATHIRSLQQRGWAPTGKSVRLIMAYQLATKLGRAHKFSSDKAIAGNDWLKSFMERNELSLRKPQGVSVNRALGLNKEEVDDYFQVLHRIMTDLNLHNRPSNIYNMDESGLQLNSKPNSELVVAETYTVVQKIQSGERGELVTVIGCANPEGVFLPPYCIFKGKNLKESYMHGMPPGTQIRMSQKSAYVNTGLFLDWLETHFLPKKPSGKVLLILDGHTTHLNPDTLEFAVKNDIEILCLPSHCTHYLQPMDRTFFKPLKCYFNQESNIEVEKNKFHKLNRENFGVVLNRAWNKAAIPATAKSGFEATGIYPYAPEKIPSYAFFEEGNASLGAPQNTSIARQRRTARRNSRRSNSNLATIRSGDSVFTVQLTNAESVNQSMNSNAVFIIQVTNASSTTFASTDTANVEQPLANESTPASSHKNVTDQHQTPSSKTTNNAETIINQGEKKNLTDLSDLITPTKVLKKISLIPVLENKKSSGKKQHAVHATTSDFIEEKRKRARSVSKPEKNCKVKRALSVSEFTKKTKLKRANPEKSTRAKKKNQAKKAKVLPETSSESESDLASPLLESEYEYEDESETCLYCLGLWTNDDNGEQWIRCQRCSVWLHETCAGVVETVEIYTCEFCIKKIAAQRK